MAWQMKKWYRSRTLWFNIFMTSLIALESSLGQLTAIIPAPWYGILATGLAIGNAVLRVISTTAIIK
jgi:hypothetical protein